MKKIMTALLLLFVSFTLVSCGSLGSYIVNGGKQPTPDTPGNGDGDNTEIVVTSGVSGVFTAFKEDVYYGVPQITWVDVTYNDGKIVNYYIDEIQGTIDEKTGNFAWNEKTKKELGYDYGMTVVPGNAGEWFEQALVIEDFFLEHGVEDLKMDEEGYVQELTGATMVATSYVELAKEAIANAEERKYTSLNWSLNFDWSSQKNTPQYTWVDVKYDDKGNIESYFIDELQSSAKKTQDKDGKDITVHTWNEKTKKELGTDYGMTNDPNNTIGKEWDEQAKAIEDYFLAYGPESLKLNNEGFVDGLAGATMVADSYKDLAIEAIQKSKKQSLINGTYTAFEANYNYGVPQITWVDVTYVNGKLVNYNIDEIQAVVDVITGDFTWNNKTKKELGYDYKMEQITGDDEWFKQAKAIENYFLELGPKSLEMDEEGYIDITGATMVASSYVDLAIKANLNAQNGISTAFEWSMNFDWASQKNTPQVSWVNVTKKYGEITNYYIDEIQSTAKKEQDKDGKDITVYTWNEKTKKELGTDYGMTNDPNNTIGKEWDEQAKAIEDFFLQYGPNALSINEEGFVDGIAGATMVATSYVNLANQALNKTVPLNGSFTAYKLDSYLGQLQITWVTVTYKDGQIVSYYIDEVQSNTNDNVLGWNRTKKDLGYDYKMEQFTGDPEWFKQVNVLEDYFLKYGPGALKLNAENEPDGLTGSTMTSNVYKDLAIEAIRLSHLGMTNSFEYVQTKDGVKVINNLLTIVNGKIVDKELTSFTGKLVGETPTWD